MCVGFPCRILSITDGPMPMGRLDVAGREQDVCLGYVPEAQVGDYVLIQGGFAMTVLDEQSAAESLEAWAELGMFEFPGAGRVPGGPEAVSA